MDKIPFCFPVFYHGLIARRTVYSQPEVVNLLLSGNMRAEPVKWPDVDRMTANKYINGLECFSSDRRKEIFELPDKDLLARIQKLKIQNIKTTISAFHEFLKNRTQANEETIYSLESSVRESEDPYQYYVVALREALSFTKVSKEYITTQLKNELHNLHKNSDIPDLFQLQKEAHKQGITSISMTPDKTFLSKIIGRDEIVQSICDKLKKERKHIQLRGMGGIGKSEILRKVYSWFLENPGEHFYAHIAYLYYSGKFRSDLDSAIDYPGKETSANPIEYLKHLANTSKVLLFIDDVRNQEADKSEIYEEDASFEEIVGSNISILFASRIMRMDFSLISVKPLPIESCVDIFLREYNANIDDDVMTADDTECCVRTEFSVRNYFCSTGWAEIQLFLRLLVIAARRLRIQYKLNDYPFRPAPSGKIISSVIDNLLNCINQGGNASVFLFSLKKVIDIGNRKSELSADIIQPEPPLKLRLNYYKRLFLSCLTM